MKTQILIERKKNFLEVDPNPPRKLLLATEFYDLSNNDCTGGKMNCHVRPMISCHV